MAEQWDLLFTLPNLDPPIPTPFASDGYVICSGKDPRLKQLAPNAGNTTSLKMLKKFSTAQGRRFRPGCFLIRADIPIASRQAERSELFEMRARSRRLPRFTRVVSPIRTQCSGTSHGPISFDSATSWQAETAGCRRLAGR